MLRKSLNKKTILGLDLDGVILDHSQNKIQLAKNIGVILSESETSSDIMETKIEQSAYRELQSTLYDNVKLARSTPLIPRAKEALHFLKSTGLPFVLISRRKKADCALISLTMHGLWPDYFDASNTFFVEAKKDKDIKAASIGVTHYVDDEPSVIAELKSVTTKYLFDPYLSYGDLKGDFYTIQSWDDLLKEFC